MPFSYHVEQFYTRQKRLRPSKRFKTCPQLYPPFDITMILLNQVIQILALPDGNGFFLRVVGIERGQIRSIRAAFIYRHRFRFAVVMDGFAKEVQRCCRIPSGGK